MLRRVWVPRAHGGKTRRHWMTKRQKRRAWLVALWGAAFGFGCNDAGSRSQVLTGRIDTTMGVVAIRAVSGDDVVTAAEVQRDGRFQIALPAGARYRLEVLTPSGVRQVLAHQGGTWKGLETKVCIPTDPFDMGTVGDSGTMCDPMDPSCEPGCGGGDLPPQCDPMDPKYDPMDPNCKPPEPPPTCGGANQPPCPECMDPTDPDCKTCGGPNEPPCPECMDPMDPNCKPCGGPNEPPCPDDPCMDPTDPGCTMCTDPNDPNCKPPPCNDPMDPNCMGGGTDPGPICEDPMDPNTCKDPCVIDPMQCGCNAGEDCWPPPEPPKCDPGTMCDPADTVSPTNVPGDFGCIGVIGGK